MVDGIEARIDEKRLGDRVVLRDLRLSVAAGEFVAITGPSGCGKSTLLSILAGLDSDFIGKVTARGRLGIVFQEPRLLPWYSVARNIALAAPALSPSAIAAALAAVGLAGAGPLLPRQLSLGMARRAALARALAVEPDVLLLDEPFVSLDGDSAELVRALVSQSWRDRRTTVVMVTHDLDEAERLAERIVRLAPAGCPAKV